MSFLRASRSSSRAARCSCSSGWAEDGVWEGLARPTRRLRAGRRYGPVELLEHLGEGRWRLRLEGEPAGEAPLPPYITEPLADAARYQTVYAHEAGSAAAPTAGLHFTPELLGRLDVEHVTLHVGLDTFRPVAVEELEEHRLHGERYVVRPEAWERIAAAERVLAVGTTTVRVLESLARGAPLAGRTELFVTPGFEFRRVDALLTNFHLPRSTLLALVMAFAGTDVTRELYRRRSPSATASTRSAMRCSSSSVMAVQTSSQTRHTRHGPNGHVRGPEPWTWRFWAGVCGTLRSRHT